MRKYLIYGIALLAIFGIGYKMLNRSADGTVYKTQKIANGDIMESITASGTINPLSTISVGSQASGRIAEIYVDYNSVVKKGQLLALIDQENAKATVQQREAALEIAKAQVAVEENNIKYYKKALNRISKLNASKYSTEKDLEAAERDYDNAVAQLALEQAQVKQAQASLDSAQTELSYTEIKAPVDGIVISKSVEVGQTVAASFETPEIFSVAEDLTKMQIEASVVEADIAKVKEGQKVRFTVDSYADDYFYGTVTQVRNEATTTSNVVTYTVVIGIDNSDMKLKPGMTANVEIITAEEKGVMLVPNQALRFYIDDSDNAKRYKDRGVWIIKNGHPERVTVKIGVSDDDNTQILESTLKIGDEVIVSKELSAANTQKMKFRMPH
ncbi:MAG: efflux RND transporter periplasmic adaptor subunit [Alphaproteobacteria bacterium]|nr:efflux RND transporter periplasmic adaptor subunit [Alphaproteobacteria bacterium]